MYRNLAKLSFSHINKFAIILTALCAAYLAIFLPGIFSKAYVHPFGIILCLFAGPAALYGICRMLYAILGGYQKRVRQYIAAAPEPAVSSEEKWDLYDAIDVLPERYRTVIILKYFSDMTIREISYAMNIPEGSVKAYLNRARGELRHCLKEDYLYAI